MSGGQRIWTAHDAFRDALATRPAQVAHVMPLLRCLASQHKGPICR